MSSVVKHHSAGFLAIVEDAKTRITEIDIEEYKRLLAQGEAGQLVDVREESEFAAAHAAGAIHLSKGVVERDIETKFPDKAGKLVLYCGGGYRSALVTDNIQKMGYRNVLSLDGGWRAIEASGLPLSTSPMLVFDTLNAYQRTSCLRAGIALKLFTAIAHGAHTPEALTPVCNASSKGLRVLCDYLTIIGFLTKDAGGYNLTTDSQLFLVDGSPAYLGGMVNFLFHPFIEKGLTNVLDAVRQGGTTLPDAGTVSEDNQIWVDFARDMAPLMMPAAGLIAELLAGSGPLKVLDVAAGHGLFGLTIAQSNPSAEIYALDWKNVLTVAHENAVSAGVAKRWHAIEGNAFASELGGNYDVVLVTNFIHHFDIPTNAGLLVKLRAAMKVGGKLVILESAVNDDRITPAGAGLFAMTMLTTTRSGDAYSRREIEAMCGQAGFHQMTHHPVPSTPNTVTLATN